MILFLLLLPAVIMFLVSFIKSDRVLGLLPYTTVTVLLPAVWIFCLPKPFAVIGEYLVADGMNSYVLLVSAVVSITVTTALISIKKRVAITDKAVRRFYRFFAVFWLGLNLSILANSMGLYWIGLELATLSTVYMIKTNNSNKSHREAWNYLIVGAIAVSLVLFGIILIYASARPILGEGAMNFDQLLKAAPKLSSDFLFEIGFSITAVGLFIKMGFFPMGLWLPNVERAAFYPVAALFSGILEGAVLVGLFRFSKIAVNVNYSNLLALTTLYIVITMFVVAFLLYGAKDFIRIFSLSGIEHTALISLFWVSGGVYAALLHLGAHAFIKPALFLATGVLESNGKGRIAGVLKAPKGGKNITFSGLVSLFILAVISLPPSPMFFSELSGFGSLINVAKASSHTGWGFAVIALILILLSVIFYRFITVYQSMKYEGETREFRVYYNEILALLILFAGTVALLLPQTINYLKGLQ